MTGIRLLRTVDKEIKPPVPEQKRPSPAVENPPQNFCWEEEALDGYRVIREASVYIQRAWAKFARNTDPQPSSPEQPQHKKRRRLPRSIRNKRSIDSK